MTLTEVWIADAPVWLIERARGIAKTSPVTPPRLSSNVKTVGEIMTEAGRLEGFKETEPGKLTGCCLFHEDRHPSAVIWLGDGEDLGTYHCSAGCGSFGAKGLARRLGVPFYKRRVAGGLRGGAPKPTYLLDDVGNAERLVDRFGDRIRYCPQRKIWLLWTGRHWQWDEAEHIYEYARRAVTAIFDEARDCSDDARASQLAKHAARSRSHKSLQHLIAQAATMGSVGIALTDLDPDPWLFNLENGTIDLRTGEQRAHDPTDYITKIAPVRHDRDADAPRWRQCLTEIFDGDEETIAFFQRWVGYAMTGVVRDHVVLIAYGTGRNGKSTVFERLRDVWGDYAVAVPFGAFTESRYRDDTGARPDIMRMRGARMITTSEGAFGTYLDESTIKRLSGGDHIYARGMRENGGEFQVVGKCILQTNHRPLVKGTDVALKSRLRLLPFTVSFEGREDTELPEKLREELPGILNWALQGCRQYLETEGVGVCAAVEATTRDYFTDMDVIQAFLDEWVVVGHEIVFGDLYEAYRHHCQESGTYPLSGQRLGERLTEKGIGKQKRGGRSYRTGIVLAKTVPREESAR